MLPAGASRIVGSLGHAGGYDRRRVDDWAVVSGAASEEGVDADPPVRPPNHYCTL